MPARDSMHDIVRTALIKDGWSIAADPFVIQYGEFVLFADLAAEHVWLLSKTGSELPSRSKALPSPQECASSKRRLGSI